MFIIALLKFNYLWFTKTTTYVTKEIIAFHNTEAANYYVQQTVSFSEP